MAGFNVALLSFGPAGVGKSTMIFGKDSRFKYMEDSSDLISRIVFKLLEKSEGSIQVGLSAFQIYKSESSKQEIVNDILAGLNDSACVKDFVNVQVTSIDNAKQILDNIKSKCMNWKHSKKDNTFQILPNKSHMFIRIMIKNSDVSSSIIIVDSIGYREQPDQILGKKEKDLLEYANHSYESVRYILNELIRQTEATKNQLPKVHFSKGGLWKIKQVFSIHCAASLGQLQDIYSWLCSKRRHRQKTSGIYGAARKKQEGADSRHERNN